MEHPTLNARVQGTGTGVVCMHSNASSSSQWRALMDRLSSSYRVFAPDLIGAGTGPAWPRDRVVTLHDEVALLEPVLAAAGSPLYLVGHSYGAAVALMAALARPGRIRAIAVYEPTLFSLLEESPSTKQAASGIRSAVADASLAVEAHDHASAARRFIDYWTSPGSWDRLPPSRQAPIAASIVNIAGWGRALFSEPTPLKAFRTLEIPVLCMVGAQSPVASRAVGGLLADTLPDVTMVEFAGLGHMGAVTHPDVVNEAIENFFARHPIVGQPAERPSAVRTNAQRQPDRIAAQ
ncbi:alpha/beta hydrolase [Variovorax humicola]|uniref:Alpha/beta hydrolase n=1 Tax=Variovorax humicola TaxID=1769758 RepID=A0ABU8VU77_9BURK